MIGVLKKVPGVSLGGLCVCILLGGCGHGTEQRAASGGVGGAVAGALVAGPVGAVVGAMAGGAGGAATAKGAGESR